MCNWHEAKRFSKDQFTVVWDWRFEDQPLRDCFDPEFEELEEMERRCETGTDTHYIARVRFLYDGVEMGEAQLGSCYASDCDPADDMTLSLRCSGHVEDMMEEAESEARERCVEMLDRLREDFL